tara:strand:- start:6367 stop:7551 length:1185 start_codon:yes stop_codon:yes gene_type:complete
MNEIRSDVNIIGGGLVGAITAFSLSQLKLNITLLEKNPKISKNTPFNDHRTVAISEGTKIFFEKIGLWRSISRFSEPIKRIRVIDRNLSNLLDFDNSRRESNLGYIIKNTHLINTVYDKLIKNKNIKIFNNIEETDIQNKNEITITKHKNLSILSDLNIAADGKNSYTRKKLKTSIFSKNYDKKAIVLTFTHTVDHKGTAFEFFYENGPLAILPMKKQNNKFCSSIVWTNNSEYSEKLFLLNDEKLISTLNKNINHCLGDIKFILSKQLFPITAHLNTRFYDRRLIYIGDAAHSFHPIAGQGWNLGMKEVENLYKLSKNYKSLGMKIGDSIFCKNFHNDNFFNAYRLYQVTDKLDKIFRSQNSMSYNIRSLGLNLIQNNKKIKNFISDFAMSVN